MRYFTRRLVWRTLALVASIIGIIALAMFFPLPSLESVQEAAADGGLRVAAEFSLAYAVASLTPLPKSVVSIAAGLVWGLSLGSLIVYFGALLGALLAFMIGRLLGRDLVERFTGARVAKIDTLLQRRGLTTIIGARLLPLVPFTVLNYSAGLTRIRVRDYILGTIIGMIPGTVAYVAIGAYGVNLSWEFYLAMGALGLLTIGGSIVAVRETKHHTNDGGTA
jgi:uncharacterized membrane protein YdjX (TVP38/TMEM64 family)